MREITIDTGDGSVSGSFVDGDYRPGILLAHGAGTNKDHAGMTGLADALSRTGRPVLTFNYRYTERGQRRPDPQARLLAVHRAARDWLAAETGSDVVLAGRSMGGRMGSYLAAEGEPCSALIFYGYPLHPAGKPDRLRKDHLPAIKEPMLFISGSRDALALPHLIDEWIRPLATATVEVIDDADHSFRVAKRAGKTPSEVLAEMVGISDRWLNSLA